MQSFLATIPTRSCQQFPRLDIPYCAYDFHGYDDYTGDEDRGREKGWNIYRGQTNSKDSLIGPYQSGHFPVPSGIGF